MVRLHVHPPIILILVLLLFDITHSFSYDTCMSEGLSDKNAESVIKQEKKILAAEEQIEEAQERIEKEEEQIFKAEKVIIQNLNADSATDVLKSKNPKRKLHYMHQFLRYRLSHHTILSTVLLTGGVFLIWHGLSQIIEWIPVISTPFGALIAGIFLIWLVGHEDEATK